MAQLTIRFVNFERSTALETYTRKHIEGLMRRLDRRNGQAKSIDVQFKLDAKAPLGSLKNSEVMVSYKYPGLKKVIHVKKNGIDLRAVLLDAIDATEKVIRRDTEKVESGRRTLGKSKRTVRDMKRRRSESEEF